ncbi:MAG: flagellar hook capping FlgD N-terminal domain-containing protein, partial [Sedimentisphaerales bacterium]|nr:flagellar hook capping FlgD N-terminal domain-containing protein [Sedimentisphaerales bacterium]
MSAIASTGSTSAAGLQIDYMKLLVTQMKNQDPLSPMDNAQMTTQIAQLSQLQQLETMNTSFAKVLANEQMGYASSLIGKQVAFASPEDGTLLADTVEQVTKTADGVKLRVGDYTIGLDDVQA